MGGDRVREFEQERCACKTPIAQCPGEDSCHYMRRADDMAEYIFQKYGVCIKTEVLRDALENA